MKEFECQNHSVQEVINLLRDKIKPLDLAMTAASKQKLIEWLEELKRNRETIYQARVVLKGAD
jgi:hypothetical protein